MTRIAGIEDGAAGLVQKAVFRGAKGKAGAVPEPLRLMAHSGPVMFATGFFELAIDRASRVPKGLKGLACLKAASLIGCVF